MKPDGSDKEFDSAAMWQRWTAPRGERRYLREQERLARAGIVHALAGIRRVVADPRPWIIYHPVASRTVLVGAVVAAATALVARRTRQRNAGRGGPALPAHAGEPCRAAWIGWLAPFIRFAGRALAGLTLADAIRHEYAGPEPSAAVDSARPAPEQA